MTRDKVIDLCRQYAAKRGRKLGPVVVASLMTEDGAKRTPVFSERVGQWFVAFRGSPGFDTDDHFWVDNETGDFSWNNAPLPWWFLVGSKIAFVFLVPLAEVVFLVEKTWHRFWLPRCTKCRSKLKTKQAEMCPTCGYAWHGSER